MYAQPETLSKQKLLENFWITKLLYITMLQKGGNYLIIHEWMESLEVTKDLIFLPKMHIGRVRHTCKYNFWCSKKCDINKSVHYFNYWFLYNILFSSYLSQLNYCFLYFLCYSPSFHFLPSIPLHSYSEKDKPLIDINQKWYFKLKVRPGKPV